MKTYARCKRNIYKVLSDEVLIPAGEWFEVHHEYMMCRPSGKQNMLFTNEGIAVKARDCEIVQVFTR